MPALLELVVTGFIFLAVLGIAVRFMPRSATGSIRLPAIIDQSIGMWALRRLLARATLGRRARPRAEAVAAGRAATSSEHGLLSGSPTPTLPTRFVAAKAPPQAHAVATRAAATHVAARGPERRRQHARPASALALQRRITGIVTALVVGAIVLAVAMQPRDIEGGVLSATGTPAATPTSRAAGSAGPPSDAATTPAAPTPTAADSPSPSAAVLPTPSPSARPAAATPTSTPTPTPRRTPKPTPKPTPTPKPPTPTPPPIPSPTPPPTPSPSPSESPSPSPPSPSPSA